MNINTCMDDSVFHSDSSRHIERSLGDHRLLTIVDNDNHVMVIEISSFGVEDLRRRLGFNGKSE